MLELWNKSLELQDPVIRGVVVFVCLVQKIDNAN